MLWVGDISGKWTRIVNPDCAEEFAWSPDSQTIAFSILSRDHNQGFFQTKTESTKVCITGIDGSNFNYVLEQEGTWLVRDWSLDGQRLLILRKQSGTTLENLNFDLFEFHLADVLEARPHVAAIVR